MPACKIDLRDLIRNEATRQGVDPAIALSVANTESGTCQWRPDGSVVTSSAGALGVFQLMPDTAAQLGVDPNDVNQNIQGGITYLKQLFQKYRDWNKALAAYNWGPRKVDEATAAGTSIPQQVVNYAKKVLGIGAVYSAGMSKAAATQNPAAAAAGVPYTPTTADVLAKVVPNGVTDSNKMAMIATLAVGGVLLVAWTLND